MNIVDLQAQLEADEAWRQDEIRFLQNTGAAISSEDEQRRFRRALILLLYAHFEGYCRFALVLYLQAINGEQITCGEANFALAAAALSDVFAALRDPEKRSDLFRNQLPDDRELHRFARDREFLQRTAEYEARPLNVPDKVVDTESNLWPVVLRKMLFRLGLAHDKFSHLDGEMWQLLNARNDIAHGRSKDGVDERRYLALRSAVFSIMDEVRRGVLHALLQQAYLRAAS